MALCHPSAIIDADGEFTRTLTVRMEDAASGLHVASLHSQMKSIPPDIWQSVLHEDPLPFDFLQVHECACPGA